MFVQFVRARVRDEGLLEKQMEIWRSEIRPNAIGFLGSTGGITTNGEFAVIARFESEEAARRNSDRPEQGEWWQETARALENPTFLDCTEVETFKGGGSDEAGFVQIMTGRVRDMERFRQLSRDSEELMDERPDLIGGVGGYAGDRFVEVAYFTNEAEAREGERREMPAALQDAMREWRDLVDGLEYLDIPNPILQS